MKSINNFKGVRVVILIMMYMILLYAMRIHIAYETKAYDFDFLISLLFTWPDKVVFYLYLVSFILYVYLMIKPVDNKIFKWSLILYPAITILFLFIRTVVHFGITDLLWEITMNVVYIAIPTVLAFVLLNTKSKSTKQIVATLFILEQLVFIYFLYNISGIYPTV